MTNDNLLHVAKLTPAPLTMTVPTAAKRLGIGRNQCYEAVARGELPAIRIGRRLLIPMAALERLLDAGASPKGRAR
ncbi:DNA binding domain-containing protein, excisionase family [Rhizobiales bacterium GAS113]|nr:DNA binding domain-containing protein, excisionase family [Rhizobiales bacterium GAS113]